jgi:hypothetical protein
MPTGAALTFDECNCLAVRSAVMLSQVVKFHVTEASITRALRCAGTRPRGWANAILSPRRIAFIINRPHLQ